MPTDPTTPTVSPATEAAIQQALASEQAATQSDQQIAQLQAAADQAKAALQAGQTQNVSLHQKATSDAHDALKALANDFDYQLPTDFDPPAPPPAPTPSPTPTPSPAPTGT